MEDERRWLKKAEDTQSKVSTLEKLEWRIGRKGERKENSRKGGYRKMLTCRQS